MRLAGILAAAALCLAACASPEAGPAPGRMVRADGMSVHLRQWGAGPDVFLIHGAASHSGAFAPTLAPALAGAWRVTAYDRPGLGHTAARPEGARTLGVQAEIAAGAIAEAGLERPVVVGHSYGAAVALRLALDRPDLISGLVLLAPVSHPWDGGVAWHYAVSANPVLGPVFNNLIVPLAGDRPARSALEGVFAPRPVPEGYFAAAEVDLALLLRALRANAEDMTALNAELAGQAPRYGEIRVPVAILAGAGDEVVANHIHAEALEREIPNARLTVLEGVGHMPHEARPGAVAEAAQWVRDRAQEGGA